MNDFQTTSSGGAMLKPDYTADALKRKKLQFKQKEKK